MYGSCRSQGKEGQVSHSRTMRVRKSVMLPFTAQYDEREREDMPCGKKLKHITEAVECQQSLEFLHVSGHMILSYFSSNSHSSSVSSCPQIWWVLVVVI